MDLERKKQLLEVGFGFDKLTISEVIDLCFNIDSDDTVTILLDIENEFPNEV